MSHYVIDRCWGIHEIKATKQICNDRSYKIHEIEETCDSCGLFVCIHFLSPLNRE
jgi:hypothetical protein